MYLYPYNVSQKAAEKRKLQSQYQKSIKYLLDKFYEIRVFYITEGWTIEDKQSLGCR